MPVSRAELEGAEVTYPALVNGVKPPAVYTVHFDASRFASGVYMYRLAAGPFVATKKMTLLK